MVPLAEEGRKECQGKRALGEPKVNAARWAALGHPACLDQEDRKEHWYVL